MKPRFPGFGHARRSHNRAAVLLLLLAVVASPAFAADEATASNLPKIINFTILATILALALRKPLGSYLEARASQIREQLAEARANREEAARAREAAAQRTATLDEAVEAARQRIAEAANTEGQRIVTAAEEQAKRISVAAEAELSKEVRLAERRLATGAARAAVEIARARLRNTMSDEDHRRLLDSGIREIRHD